ncbi:MAG: DUF3179 domain-containing protein [Bacteroidota bacterium]
MLHKIHFLIGLCLLISFSACERDPESLRPTGPDFGTDKEEPGLSGDWLIPVSEIRDGGPGKDGIPSIQSPQFVPVEAIDFMLEDDLIIGVRVGNTVRGYPHPILDWHEIVNDQIDDEYFAVTYCPLTGTAIGWDRTLNGTTTTFGVSGLLYNSNLIPFDRETDSNWSQMRLNCVNGELIETDIRTFPVIETTWRTWRQMFPDAMVQNTNTGFERNYGQYPYGDYRSSEALIFGVLPDDTRLPRKERVLGVVDNGRARTYRFDAFDSDEVVIKYDKFMGTELVIVGSERDNFLVAFQQQLKNETLNFKVSERYPAALLEDDEGNQWDLFGLAISGPRTGQRLEMANAYLGYWFAWGAFYPDCEIVSE